MKIFLYFFLSAITFSLPAQILNVEQFRPDKDTSHLWLGTVNLGFSTKKQLANVLTFNTDANVAYMSSSHTILFLNHIGLVKISGSNVVSEGYFHSRINLWRKRFISYEPFIQYQYDIGRGLEARELTGFTFRMDVKSEDRIVIGFNSGIMYEHEIWKGQVRRFSTDTSNTRAETSFIKSTSNFSVNYKFRPGVSIFSLTYYQARFEKFFSPRVISDTRLQFIISKYLSFSVQYVMTFDDNPVITNTQIIYSISNTIVIKFP